MVRQARETLRNISASAWYLKPDKYDARDETLCANHRRGLYYTWSKDLYVHTLFFNFKPATYMLDATKVAHIGVPAAVSRRRGPQLIKTCVWGDAATAWDQQVAADDGFSAIVAECGPATDEIRRIADASPLAAERVLALCAGKIGHAEDWHRLDRLDSCVIDSTEVIHRITFCQDTEESARDFRIARLRRCGYLWGILTTHQLLPPSLADFKDGFRLEWSADFPHQNSASLKNRRATVIYMGEEPSADQVEATAKRAAEFLNRAFADPDMSHDARQRLAVWFRDANGFVLYDPHRLLKYDQPGNCSEFDIGRET